MKKKDKKEVVNTVKKKDKKKSDKIFYICLVVVTFLAFTGVGLYVYFFYNPYRDLVIDGRTINADTIYSEVETKIGFMSKYYVKNGKINYYVKDLYTDKDIKKLSDLEKSLICMNNTSVQTKEYNLAVASSINSMVPNAIIDGSEIKYRPFNVYKAIGEVLFDTKLTKDNVNSECSDYYYDKVMDAYFEVNKCINNSLLDVYSVVNISKFEHDTDYVYAYVEQGVLIPDSNDKNKPYNLYVYGKDDPVISGISEKNAENYVVNDKNKDKLNKYKFTFKDIGEYTYAFDKVERIK